MRRRQQCWVLTLVWLLVQVTATPDVDTGDEQALVASPNREPIPEAGVTASRLTAPNLTAPESSSQQQTPMDPPTKGLPPAGEPGVQIGDASAMLLEKLGPAVLHKDGTMSRVADWHKMDAVEKARVVRIITARNKRRVAQLRGSDAEKQEL